MPRTTVTASPTWALANSSPIAGNLQMQNIGAVDLHVIRAASLPAEDAKGYIVLEPQVEHPPPGAATLDAAFVGGAGTNVYVRGLAGGALSIGWDE